MWNTFIFNENTYIIKIIESTKYKIVLSDLENLWIEELSKDEVVERAKTLNPFLNTENDEYLNTVLNVLKEIANNELNITKEGDLLKLDCKTKLDSISFKFCFNLKFSCNSEFCKEITVPMIQTIQYLEKQQRKLCELLVKKDAEIEQHIFENGSIKREEVITEKFDSNKFNESKSKNLCCNVLSDSEKFSNHLIAKYGCSEPELLTVKKEEKKATKNKKSYAKTIINHKRIKKVDVKDEAVK